MARILAMLAALIALATPATAADDISATARGVVRVVTIAMVDDEVVGFGHGSGFAVAPNRIVTNAHVVDLAQRYPDNVVVGVVPSEGAKSYEGKVIAIDRLRDLALIEFTGKPLPKVALYTGPIGEGGMVTALGYPGNVDLATAKSMTDYIHPLSPVRSEGVFSGRRQMSGVQVLLHTAGIARGNSGGPLLDPCGRVIGVNSAITRGEEGDSSFGFAIADSELADFLREAKQPYTAVGSPCTSMTDLMRRDSDARAAASLAEAAKARDAAAKAAAVHEAALTKARAETETHRENVIALAAVLLVFGALALGGAGLLETRGKRREAIWVAAGGGVLLLGAAIIFFTRPDGVVTVPDVQETDAPKQATALPTGKLVCSFAPELSRAIVTPTEDVTLDWAKSGCVNGRTQYAEDGDTWDRVLVPNEEQTVSVLQFDPATRTYSNLHYFLSAEEMEAARKLRAQVTLKACSPDEAARNMLSSQQASIRAALPPEPNEKLVYSCKSAE